MIKVLIEIHYTYVIVDVTMQRTNVVNREYSIVR